MDKHLFRRVRAGETISAAQWNEMLSALELLLRQNGTVSREKPLSHSRYPVVSGKPAGGAVVLVKIIEDDSFPTTAARKVFYAEKYTIEFDEEEGATATLSATGENLYVANFRENIPLVDTYYFAVKIGGKWVLDNQATFLESM